MIRTYKLKHDINREKQDKILAIMREYRIVSRRIANLQWRLVFETGNLNKMAKIKDIPSALSERYKRNSCYQVVSMLKSFISNRQNDFVKTIYGSGLDEKTRIELLRINRRKLWFNKTHDKFSEEHLFLARKIFKHIFSCHRKPSLRHCNMLLNKNVAEIIIADKKQTKNFDYWIRLSTLNKGNPIMLPIKTNKYFEGIKGEIVPSIQINKNKNGRIEISFMKDLPIEKLIFKLDEISIDIGLKTLVALDNGNLFGRIIYDKLKYYDSIITKLAQNRQRQGLKTRSRRYDLLIKRLRSWLKNEINRIFNRIIKLYAPKKIVVEKLDFRRMGLSKRMNRLLSNFGKKILEQKLNDLHERFGIEIQKINPAYTSQECPNCHYVDKRNRPKQEIFRCKNCNYGRNADVVAARNHHIRSSDKELSNIYINKKVILHKLVIRFLKRHPRHHSLANGLLHGNPYFRNYLAQPKLVA